MTEGIHFLYACTRNADLAQLVEHLICNQTVIGSNPIVGLSLPRIALSVDFFRLGPAISRKLVRAKPFRAIDIDRHQTASLLFQDQQDPDAPRHHPLDLRLLHAEQRDA